MAYKYENHLKQIEEDWDSVDSFCKHKFLNFPCVTKLVSRSGKEHSLKSVEYTASCRGDFHKFKLYFKDAVMLL